MPKKLAAVLLVVAVALALFSAPAPASADMGTKAVNTLSNTLLGWTNCPKAWIDEGTKWGNPVRGVTGVLVTGPSMCAVNTALTYTGVVVDAFTLWDGKNVLPPAAHESVKPPVRLPW